MTSSRAGGPIRQSRKKRREQEFEDWVRATQTAVFLGVAGGLLMASVVEIYQANLLRQGQNLPQWTHTEAFFAACAGFYPAFACLQRLNSRSWAQAIRDTLPWTILLIDVALSLLLRLHWYWAAGLSIILGVAAYSVMVRSARVAHNGG